MKIVPLLLFEAQGPRCWATVLPHQAIMPNKRRLSEEEERVKKGKLNMNSSKVDMTAFFSTAQQKGNMEGKATMDDQLVEDSPVEIPLAGPFENEVKNTLEKKNTLEEDIPAGQPGAVSEIEEFMNKVDEDCPVKEKPLTEATIEEYEKDLQKLTSSMHKKKKDAEPATLGQQDKRRYEAMLEAFTEGEVNPRSSLGVQFRAEHVKGSPAGNSFLKLKREETNDRMTDLQVHNYLSFGLL